MRSIVGKMQSTLPGRTISVISLRSEEVRLSVSLSPFYVLAWSSELTRMTHISLQCRHLQSSKSLHHLPSSRLVRFRQRSRRKRVTNQRDFETLDRGSYYRWYWFRGECLSRSQIDAPKGFKVFQYTGSSILLTPSLLCTFPPSPSTFLFTFHNRRLPEPQSSTFQL